MILSTSFAFALWALVAQGGVSVAAPTDLAAAKALYASGAYEEALSRLSAASTDTTADEQDEYRALCLLALGRTADAQRSLETLVARSPLFKMSEAEVSPRLVTLFHDARKRLLPAVVRDLYTKAKTNFDQKQYTTAKPQLTDLLVLLADDDLSDEAAALVDLKLVGEGFLKLTEMELAAAARAEAAPPASAAVTPSAASAASADPIPTGPPPLKIYSRDDKDVSAPVDVLCPLPEWLPPKQLDHRREYRGVLRVVIDERGRVEVAALLASVNPTYDRLLLAAARQWAYRPALKNGEPVKYQKLIDVVLRPR